MMKKIFDTPRKRRAALIGAVVLAIVVTGITAQFINTKTAFKHFEPAYLPSGISIKAKRIGIADNNVQTNQNFRTEDWAYGIYEYSSDSRNGSGTIGSAEQNYDPKSTKPTCNIQDSPSGVQYRLCHWVDYERINVHEVTFIKSGTFIQSKFPSNLDTDISIAEIDKYVDSFKEKSTFTLPVLRSNGA